MKTLILAGGLGTRIMEETKRIPKPLIEIGDVPILMHIIEIYRKFGHNHFVIAGGYKSGEVVNYFKDLPFYVQQKIQFDYSNVPSAQIQNVPKKLIGLKVDVHDTGIHTQTAGRIKRLESEVGDLFFATYGDGIANIDLNLLLDSHLKSGKLATLTTVQPTGRFGSLLVKDSEVVSFVEKPKGDNQFVNGGFFVFNSEIFKYDLNDSSVLEIDLLPKLAEAGELSAYRHNGFWQPLDTMRDKVILEEIYMKQKQDWFNVQ